MPMVRTKKNIKKLAKLAEERAEEKRQNHIAACVASAIAMMDESGVPYSITINGNTMKKGNESK